MMAMPPRPDPDYTRKLSRVLVLDDGTRIVTLLDAARIVRERFVVATAWPLLELSIEQLMTAAATGDAADVLAATDSLERVLRARRLL